MDTPQSPHACGQADRAVLVFGPFALHRASQQLLKGGQAVRIGSRAFTLLVDLVESAGQLRTRAQLEARVWPRSIVEETSLRVHMSALRRVLGDGRDGARYIENVPGCGYIFVGTVTRLGAAQAVRTPAEPRTHLIGRGAELQSLRGLCANNRLLSIVGPGGIGKSVLALAVAELVRERFADGFLVADLAAATEAEGVVDAVAEAAGVTLAPPNRIAALCSGLGQRRLLLVLDNCDRAVEGAAGLAIALLQRTEQVHVLATTREPLDVQGERVRWLDALRTPFHAMDEPGAALSYAAVSLFVERASAHSDRFVLDGANVADVCRLCRYLDGIPLAIELAAARVEALGVAGLAASLADLPGLLTRARRTSLPRHRTIEATLAWSYDLLDRHEQAVLCRTAVFQADFSIAAARAVCACAAIDEATVARCVESLAAKSLLVRRVKGSSVLYRQLLLTRTHMFGKLDTDEKAWLASRHARHVAALLAGSPAAAAVQAPLPWADAHGRTFEDVRMALDWAFGKQGDRSLGIAMTPNLIYTLRFLDLPDDVRRGMISSLDEGGAPRQSPEAALCLCAAQAVLGAYSHTGFDLLREVMARLHALLRVVHAAPLRGAALLSMSAAAYALGDAGMMLEIVRELRALARQEGDTAAARIADRLESGARHLCGEQERAAVLCRRVLASTSEPAAPAVSCSLTSPIGVRWHLARIAWLRGQPAQAARIAAEALAYAEQRHPVDACQTLVMAVLPVAIWRGDDDCAAQLAARLRALGEACRSPYWRDWADAFEAALRRRACAALMDEPAENPAALAPIAHDLLATFDAGMLSAASLARADAGAIGWCAPEIWRVQGERLLRQGSQMRDAACNLFLRAFALARRQQALGWELRIACSLARCWRGSARAEEGRGMVADALARMGDGCDGADCRAAQACLAFAPHSALLGAPS